MQTPGSQKVCACVRADQSSWKAPRPLCTEERRPHRRRARLCLTFGPIKGACFVLGLHIVLAGCALQAPRRACCRASFVARLEGWAGGLGLGLSLSLRKLGEAGCHGVICHRSRCAWFDLLLPLPCWAAVLAHWAPSPMGQHEGRQTAMFGPLGAHLPEMRCAHRHLGLCFEHVCGGAPHSQHHRSCLRLSTCSSVGPLRVWATDVSSIPAPGVAPHRRIVVGRYPPQARTQPVVGRTCCRAHHVDRKCVDLGSCGISHRRSPDS